MRHHLVKVQPVALDNHKLPFIAQMGKVHILMIRLGRVQCSFLHCTGHINQHHGVH